MLLLGDHIISNLILAMCWKKVNPLVSPQNLIFLGSQDQIHFRKLRSALFRRKKTTKEPKKK